MIDNFEERVMGALNAIGKWAGPGLNETLRKTMCDPMPISRPSYEEDRVGSVSKALEEFCVLHKIRIAEVHFELIGGIMHTVRVEKLNEEG